ncbi:MAG: orotate phosphoribosyltransferase [Thermoleophilia bacterium]|nr:orotate phosphoribosyltransferase [Thermoleophilia bacterium]
MPDTLGIANTLFERALLRGTFTLRSGATSDRYFDKYRVTCDPELLAPVTEGLAVLLADAAFAMPIERIVAPALGAVPLAAALSLASGVPFVIVRVDAKEHGTASRIEGTLYEGERALLLEDVVTSGGAALEALEVARAAGLIIEHAACVLDRDGGGAEALAAAGAPVRPLLHIRDLTAAFAAGIGTEVGAR